MKSMNLEKIVDAIYESRRWNRIVRLLLDAPLDGVLPAMRAAGIECDGVYFPTYDGDAALDVWAHDDGGREDFRLLIRTT